MRAGMASGAPLRGAQSMQAPSCGRVPCSCGTHPSAYGCILCSQNQSLRTWPAHVVWHQSGIPSDAEPTLVRQLNIKCMWRPHQQTGVVAAPVESPIHPSRCVKQERMRWPRQQPSAPTGRKLAQVNASGGCFSDSSSWHLHEGRTRCLYNRA